MDLYTLIFQEPEGNWLSAARNQDQRLQLAEVTLGAIAAAGERSLVIMPAGFLRTTSDLGRDRIAAHLLEQSRRLNLSLLFGIDRAIEMGWPPLQAPPDHQIFGCVRGERAFWGVSPRQELRTQRSTACHLLVSEGMRIALLLGNEVFQLPCRRAVEQQRADLAIVMAHTRLSDRWQPALAALDKIVPVLVAAPDATADAIPRGWRRATVGSSPALTVARFRHYLTESPERVTTQAA